MSAAMNVKEALEEASSFLAAANVAEPEPNARLLLGHVLGLSPALLLAAGRDLFPAGRIDEWEEVISRKAKGEPAQYIIGEQEFYGLPFTVNPSVLIPRPETELLVERIAELGQRLWPEGRLLAADIGTGSGAIAGALKFLRPGWNVMASDISPAALEVAKGNASKLRLEISFREGNLLEPFAGLAPDIIVSNPPYIPAEVIEGLQTEVRDFEPRSALDGGPDGLEPYRIMMRQLPLLAAPPALIGFELGIGQAGEVAEMLREAGAWSRIEVVKDYAGIERHVIGIF
nr:peptide chain release factor N(5)-glutamine methyltransferase [Paenibacillus caui]